MFVLSSSDIRFEEEKLFSMGQTPLALMSIVGAMSALKFIEDFKNVCKVVAVCGKGNNAGDALALLYNLKLKGYDCSIYQPWGAATEECRVQRELCRSLGIEETSDLKSADVIVEGLLGVGFYGNLREETLKLIREINNLNKPIVSMDIPAGLNSDTGEPQPDAIRAAYTYSIGFLKRGYLFRQSYEYTGKVIVIDIGFPPPENGLKIFTSSDAKTLIKKKDDFSHKVEKGSLLVWAGSKQYPGALRLCLEGALNMGVGMSFSIVEDEFSILPPETIPIAERDFISNEIDEKISKKFRAVLIGPGLTNKRETFIKEFVSKTSLPLILDADALFPDIVDLIKDKEVVITPHEGEFRRIYKNDSDRVERFEAFLEQFPNITLVLKGPNTLVGKGSQKYVVPIADCDLAVAGSGDVLSGMIGALLSTGYDTLTASLLAVFVHAIIPEIARQKNMRVTRSSDLIKLLKALGGFENIIESCDFI
ncbi:YjeF-related protein [Thermodesulfobium narugense DSM 14796]|uniref:Bifunctional NAD(P)H-hydrate repair enzyme n=1 Tax=Thermodesulfobium narugense DSM 14796 TaxID=747365 RepID=M1E5Q8_9BACT|nr:bifunctional ADP-dependent NAD(P)H-hydrate dehydratase/NAD(P)H-hydrate epimerase [Thermodesulfobium narugense]AEE14426.1 YjeF-related protein [Thermodesulfobium narugense DSM 14796]